MKQGTTFLIRRVTIGLAISLGTTAFGCGGTTFQSVDGEPPKLPAVETITSCEIEILRNDAPGVWTPAIAKIENPEQIKRVHYLLQAGKPWSVSEEQPINGDVKFHLRDKTTIQYDLMQPGFFRVHNAQDAPWMLYDSLGLGALAGQAASAPPTIAE